MPPLRFAVIGVDHAHIFGQVDALLRAGAELTSFHADSGLVNGFIERYPQVPRVDDRRRILEDPGIPLIVSAGIPCERAPLGIEVMRHGKDYMVDKPGMTSLEQLAAVRRVQAETKRIYSICYSEHFETRSTVKAGELVHSGAIGKVINTTGLGPHRLNKATRPDWFFKREKYGGVLTDIASHQCEQFLFFTRASDVEIVAATVANRANPETPEGLPTWGDGRLFIVGTEGTIELRKYVDIAGRPGADHFFLVDRKGVHRIDCSAVELPYGRQLVSDVLERTETAMPQERCFRAMELALTAQAMAEKA
jgi:predicted dehydrogenase